MKMHTTKSGRRLSLAGMAACAVLAFSLVHGAVAAQGADNFCRTTTHRVFRSCKTGARSDYWLALGNCSNLSSPVQRMACRRQALADLKDALQTCRDQRDARQAVCGAVGGARYAPVINPADYVAVVDNPYFPLTPGTTLIYEGQTPQGLEHEEFVVTSNTKVILGVTCTEVHDTVSVGGEVIEDTLDWFAQDTAGDVWYFGENSKEMAGGLVVSLEGSWTAGVDGAKPGIIMKANPAVGDFYRQEFALDTAEDVAEVLSLTEAVIVPFGAFSNCLQTEETTPMEPDLLEHKFYATGLGNVLTVDVVTGQRLELIQVITP